MLLQMMILCLPAIKMLPFWLLILLLLFFIVFRHLDKHRHFWARRGIPGPAASSPLFGHYWQLRLPNKGTIVQLRQWTQRFGPFYGLSDGVRKILVISDLAMVQEVLVTKFDVFEARKLNTVADGVTSQLNEGSILHVTSFRWKRLRQITATFFNAISIRRALPTFQSSVHLFDENFVPSDTSIDIQPLLQQLSDQILASVILGDAVAAGQPHFHCMLQAIEAKTRHPLGRLSSVLCTICPPMRAPINWLNNSDWMAGSNQHLNGQMFAHLMAKVEARKGMEKRSSGPAGRGVNSRNSSSKRGEGGQGDGGFVFLDHLLAHHGQQREKHNNHFGGGNSSAFGSCNFGRHSQKELSRQMSTSEIASACSNFLYAGHKTLARALTTVVHCLAAHEHVQQQIYENELQSLDKDFCFEQIEGLQLLDFAIREALRLFPLGSEHVARKCMARTRLLGKEGEVELEPGHFVMVDVLSVHLDPALWGPRPECFEPSRWLNIDSSNIASQFLAFGQGPRICLGEKYAMLHMKMLLAMLFTRFRVVPAQQQKEEGWDPSTNLRETMLHQQLMVRLSLRRNSVDGGNA